MGLDCMSKKIVINNCYDCPHKKHNGGFGQVMYVPKCSLTNKTLGYYEVAQKKGRTAYLVAKYDEKIPSWCPLQDN